MTFTVTIEIRDGKKHVYECVERPSIDSMWTRLYLKPEKYLCLRSEMIETIIVVENRSTKPRNKTAHTKPKTAQGEAKK